jgi:molecular chaperone GrpE
VVIRDRRRIDPVSGQPRQPDPADTPASPPEPDPKVAELVDDIKRLKAEYDNYRRRVERDRQATVDAAHASVLANLLPVLDDIERARSHGDLQGAFGAVGESLVGIVTKLGLEQFGETGELFDPTVHEALVHTVAPGVSGPTVVEVYRAGYRYAGKVLRPAQVVVGDVLHEDSDETPTEQAES